MTPGTIGCITLALSLKTRTMPAWITTARISVEISTATWSPFRRLTMKMYFMAPASAPTAIATAKPTGLGKPSVWAT